MKLSRSAVLALAGASLAAMGCSRLDMQDQPKYKPQRPSDFFADGRSEREPVEGTIARGQLNEDTEFYEGKDAGGKDIETFPIAVDKAVIERGQNRFDIYCAPCHGRIGNGLGMIVRRGFKQPPSYHIDRLRQAPVGHLYDVITNGYGAMLNYASQVQPGDRWAIVAYIRALQYSQNANINDLPAEARARIPAAGQPPSAAEANEPLAPPDADFHELPDGTGDPVGRSRRVRSGRGAIQSAGETMTTTEQSFAITPQLGDKLKRYQNTSAFVGLVFLALLVSGYFLVSPQQFFRSYLVGFFFWFGMGAGCLLLLMTQYLTGGAWGMMIRRPLEAGSRTLYVMFWGFLPLLTGRAYAVLVVNSGRVSRQSHSVQASLPERAVFVGALGDLWRGLAGIDLPAQ